MKTVTALLLIVFCSCSSSKEVSSSLSENIESVYYQKWVAGIQNGSSGINFYIVFKKPLNNEYKLEKVNFLSNEATFEKISETEYVAKIMTYQNDLILDKDPQKEYGNKAPEVKLKPDEANLYFNIKGKEHIQNIENVKEKPMIAYPSIKTTKN